ncbi:MAG: hypothetical protein Q9N02_09945, partial [Ghiorsea sp.]|nr:hypothetical protein [Ghiorsea sp.]
MSFWFKPRQVVVMDAHGGRPARNFYVRTITLFLFFLLLTGAAFALGVWLAPFHSVQKVMPKNSELKRQNQDLQHNLADASTRDELKNQQLESLQEQVSAREQDVRRLTKELHMFKSILDERKGKGIQVIAHKANWQGSELLVWQALFVKGGSYPRYLRGTYKLFAFDGQGHRQALFVDAERY